MHPKMAKKKNPFRKRLYSTAELSNSESNTIVEGFEIGEDTEVEVVGIIGVVGMSSGSEAPPRNSAFPYRASVQRQKYQRVHANDEKVGRKVLYSSTRIPSSGTGSSPLFVILTGFTGLSPGAFGTFSIFSTIS
jgi:hypothetical protein